MFRDRLCRQRGLIPVSESRMAAYGADAMKRRGGRRIFRDRLCRQRGLIPVSESRMATFVFLERVSQARLIITHIRRSMTSTENRQSILVSIHSILLIRDTFALKCCPAQ